MNRAVVDLVAVKRAFRAAAEKALAPNEESIPRKKRERRRRRWLREADEKVLMEK